MAAVEPVQPPGEQCLRQGAEPLADVRPAVDHLPQGSLGLLGLRSLSQAWQHVLFGLDEKGCQEPLAVLEVPVERADAYAGTLRDLPDLGVQTPPREDGGGGLKDALAVRDGVRALRLPGACGQRSHRAYDTTLG